MAAATIARCSRCCRSLLLSLSLLLALFACCCCASRPHRAQRPLDHVEPALSSFSLLPSPCPSPSPPSGLQPNSQVLLCFDCIEDNSTSSPVHALDICPVPATLNQTVVASSEVGPLQQGYSFKEELALNYSADTRELNHVVTAQHEGNWKIANGNWKWESPAPLPPPGTDPLPPADQTNLVVARITDREATANTTQSSIVQSPRPLPPPPGAHPLPPADQTNLVVAPITDRKATPNTTQSSIVQSPRPLPPPPGTDPLPPADQTNLVFACITDREATPNTTQSSPSTDPLPPPETNLPVEYITDREATSNITQSSTIEHNSNYIATSATLVSHQKLIVATSLILIVVGLAVIHKRYRLRLMTTALPERAGTIQKRVDKLH